ncbi:unnamed protein product [Aphanomyces euteiches]
MASRYAKNVKVPADFPDMLRNFAREVLRNQEKIKTKDDILQYGIKYFTDLTNKNAGLTNGPSDETEVYMQMSDEEIEEYMWQIFRASDPANAGELDEGDFKKMSELMRKVFNEIADYLHLNPVERKRCATVAENIESYDASTSKEVIVKSSNCLCHGLLREEFESMLREILHHSDADNSGTISRTELDPDLGLTRKETNLVLFDIPCDEGGRVFYQDIIPSVFDVLVHAAANDVLDLPRSEEQIENILTRVFSSGDEESTGLLSFGALKNLLRMTGLGLTRIQIIALMSEAQEEEDDSVSYEQFTKSITPMVFSLVDYDQQPKMAQMVPVYRGTEEYFSNALSIAFEAIDETQRGLVPRHEIVEAIQNALPKISTQYIAALLALGDVDDNGDVEYSVIIHNGFQALQWLQEYDALSSLQHHEEIPAAKKHAIENQQQAKDDHPFGIQIDRKEPAARGKVHRTTLVRKTPSSPDFNDILPKTIVDFTEDSNEKKRKNPSLHAIHREFNAENATTESTSATASNQDEPNDIPRPQKTISFKPILKARLAKIATIRGLSESKKADRARHITWQEENTDANFSSDEPATSSEASDTSSERQSSDDVEDIFSGITLNFMDELKHEMQDSQIFRDLNREFDMAPANTLTIENVLNSAKIDLANSIKPKVTPRRMTLQDAIKAGHVQTKQKIDQVQNAKPVRSTSIRAVEPQTKLVQERKAMAKTKLDQKCTSLATSKTKLPPLVVAKNEEIAQLKAQLAEVKADLVEAEYDLVVHAQTEKHLRELNDERLQEIDALTQLLSQERIEFEHQREENCHLTQCVEELKGQNHNQKNYQIKYETIVVEFEEARRHWSATQTTSEERLGYYKQQLATAQRRLGSAIHDKLECENILYQTVQENDDSPVRTACYSMEDRTPQILATARTQNAEIGHKAKLSPGLVAKDEETALPTSEPVAVQSELASTEHELCIHEQNDCDLLREFNASYQKFHDLANDNRKLQTTVENLTAGYTRDGQTVNELDFIVQSGSQTQLETMQEMMQQLLQENEVLHNDKKASNNAQQALEAQLREVHSRNDILLTRCDEYESKIEGLESKLHEAQRAKQIWESKLDDDRATAMDQDIHAHGQETMAQLQHEGATNDKHDGETQIPEVQFRK